MACATAGNVGPAHGWRMGDARPQRALAGHAHGVGTVRPYAGPCAGPVSAALAGRATTLRCLAAAASAAAAAAMRTLDGMQSPAQLQRNRVACTLRPSPRHHISRPACSWEREPLSSQITAGRRRRRRALEIGTIESSTSGELVSQRACL